MRAKRAVKAVVKFLVDILTDQQWRVVWGLYSQTKADGPKLLKKNRYGS
jgi:hypothetical protein